MNFILVREDVCIRIGSTSSRSEFTMKMDFLKLRKFRAALVADRLNQIEYESAFAGP